MKSITWTVALALATFLPALAAPSPNSGGDWNNEGSDEANKFRGWGDSSPYKPGFSKPGSPSSGQPAWDGTCGGDEGNSCSGSWAGQCCSKDGQCGSTNLHCGKGCQPEFGKCAPGVETETTSIIAPVPTSYAPSSYSSILSSLSSQSSAEASTAAVSTETNAAAGQTNSLPDSLATDTACSNNIVTVTSVSTQVSVSTVVIGGSSTFPSASAGESQTASLSSTGASSLSAGSSFTSLSTPSSGASLGSSALSSLLPSSSAPAGFFTGSSAWSSSINTITTTTPSTAASAGASTDSSVGSLADSSSASSSWTGIANNTAGSPPGYPGSPSGQTGSSSGGLSVGTSIASEAANATTGPSFTGSGSVTLSSVTGIPSGVTSLSSMTTVVSGQTIPSYPSGSGSVSTAPGTSIVTSPTIRPSHGFGNSSSRPITTSLPVTTSAILPNVTTSLNSTKPSNTTAACTTKPTPQCIPCEGAPDPSAPWCGYDINTDFYKYVPRTCKTVEYDFVVTNTTISPDGVPRMGLLVNGQMPGPAIEANWGDTVVVRLTNNLPADGNNGTTFHFHGLRQNYTNEMDGVPSITQCPVAPGESMTYTWVATQYGTSWYHSHFQLQAWEGVMGPIVIHGPSSADYDVDMGPIVLQDWSHQTVDQMYDAAQDGTTGGPRVLDTGLINGMNVFGADGASNQTGKRYQLEFIPGKKHLLRVVNTAIQSTFKFYIDGHKLQVISTDFVPIKPYTTSILNINIGQRYDVIVEANQPVGDYWMRSDNQDACAVITNAKNIKGIVHYAGSSGSTPTSVGFNYTSECVDEPSSSLIPVVPYTVGSSNTEYDETVVVSANNSLNLYRWYLYGTTSATPETFQSEWSDPTLYEIWKNDTVPPYSGGLAISVPKLKEWVYVVIESPIPLPHPIHLHGHDFYILGSGSGTYDSSSSASLNLNNPPRRDVALLPTAGYLVLAFQTDNPGVWLMHCHIGWHTSMGFAMQIVEAQDLIKPSIDDTCLLDDTCKSWRKYANSASLTTTDSGV